MESLLNPSSKGFFIMINNLAYSAAARYGLMTQASQQSLSTMSNSQMMLICLSLRPTSHPFHYLIPLINALEDKCECASS